MQPAPPFGYGAYEPPPSKRGRPSVILWYRTYCAIATLLYGGFLASMFGVDPNLAVLFALFVAPLVVLHVVGAAVPYKPWGWTLALVLVCFGLVTCLMPFALGLLLYWREPTVKAAFCRM
ncbi:MAG: hypothetical protein KIT84_38890 [Labilithrix sp.]|nr:hypothetical protein [Labilithrix sp.]MCW5817029.1 hypothetical protein [Labilithrix sp.]